MSEILRQNPFLDEILTDLDNKLAIHGVEVWERLSKQENEWIDDEIFHCMTDARYFISNYYAYRDEKEGFKSLYPLFDSQEILYEEYRRLEKEHGKVRALILKARQMGSTTYNLAEFFHKTVFSEHIQSLIVGPDDDTSRYFMGMYESALDFMPWWMRPRTKTKNTGQHINFDEKDESLRATRPGLKSWVYADNAKKSSGVGRGKTFNRAFMSELAFWDNGSQLSKSLFPTFNTPDGFYIMESTANGRNDYWHNLWRRAEAGKIDWHPIFIPFYRREVTYSMPIKPGVNFELSEEETDLRERTLKRDSYLIKDEVINWMRNRKEEFIATDPAGTDQLFYQEYPLEAEDAFQNQDVSAFSRKAINRLQKRTTNPIWIGEISIGEDATKPWVLSGKAVKPNDSIQYPEDKGTRFSIFEYPKTGARYCVGVDVGLGNPGGDYSCIQVVKDGAHMDQQVACWHGYIHPAALARIIYAIGMFYNYALAAVEVNSFGVQTNYELMANLEYDNIYRFKHLDKAERQMTNFIGFLSTSKSTDGLLAKMSEYLIDDCFDIPCKFTVDELVDYTEESGAKGEGSHDDMVDALMIALYCLHEGETRKDSKPKTENDNADTYYIMGRNRTVILKTTSKVDALKSVKLHVGSQLYRRSGQMLEVAGTDKKVTADFQNTEYSPVHDGKGPAHKLHYDEGVSADEIDGEMIQEYEAAMDASAESDPDSWRWA